jgi:Cys-rich protein (TIGR01571 family)
LASEGEKKNLNICTKNSFAMAEWNSKLFGCADEGVSSCLYAFCCPSCAVADARVNMDGSSWCFNCLCVGSVQGYSIIREGYNINGSCFQDILIGCFCSPCAASQLVRETHSRSKLPGKAGGAGSEQWKNGLFSCMSKTDTCCYVCMCPSCALGSARQAYDGSDCCFNCLCMSTPLTSSIIREGYNIEGTCNSDLLKGCFCSACTICQFFNEAKERGAKPEAGGTVVQMAGGGDGV